VHALNFYGKETSVLYVVLRTSKLEIKNNNVIHPTNH
jgi:hypothetical protein